MWSHHLFFPKFLSLLLLQVGSFHIVTYANGFLMEMVTFFYWCILIFESKFTRILTKTVFFLPWICLWQSDAKHPGCDPSFLCRKEFSFTLEHDIYIRYLSFRDATEMEAAVWEKCPYKIDIGAVYNVDVSWFLVFLGENYCQFRFIPDVSLWLSWLWYENVCGSRICLLHELRTVYQEYCTCSLHKKLHIQNCFCGYYDFFVCL